MEKTCIKCGKSFEAEGRIKICIECKKEYNKKRQHDFAVKTGKFVLQQKICKVCGKEFETYRSTQVCCSEECSVKNGILHAMKYSLKNKEKFDELKRVREREKYRKKVGMVEGATRICPKCGNEFPRVHRRKYCDNCRKA